MKEYSCIDITSPNVPKQNHANTPKLLIFMAMTQFKNVKIALDSRDLNLLDVLSVY